MKEIIQEASPVNVYTNKYISMTQQGNNKAITERSSQKNSAFNNDINQLFEEKKLKLVEGFHFRQYKCMFKYKYTLGDRTQLGLP